MYAFDKLGDADENSDDDTAADDEIIQETEAAAQGNNGIVYREPDVEASDGNMLYSNGKSDWHIVLEEEEPDREIGTPVPEEVIEADEPPPRTPSPHLMRDSDGLRASLFIDIEIQTFF